MNKNLVFGGILFMVGICSFSYSAWGVLFFQPTEETLSLPKNASEAFPQNTIKSAPINYDVTLAQQAFSEGRYANTAKMIEQKTGKLNEQEALLLAKAQEKMGEWENAQKTIEKAMTTPASLPVLSAWIEVVLKQGNVVKANEILKEFPESEEKHFYTMILSLAESNYESAKKEMNTLKNSKTFTNEYAALSEIFKTYDSFSDGSPYFLDVMVANVLETLSYPNLAIPILKKTLQESPDYRDAWIVMGNAYLSVQQFDVAESMLEKAISLDPTHPKSPYLLALALSELGMHEDALVQLEKAMKNGYEPKENIYRTKADILLRMQKYQDAFAEYEKIITSGKPSVADFTKAITISIAQLNLPQKALEIAEKANMQFPENTSLQAQKALSMSQNGNPEEAKKILQPFQNAESFLYLGQIAEQENKKDEAKQWYKSCYEKGNGNAFSSECASRYNAL